ncbi:zinc ribbon domain-containing protein [archaeon]|nr:zinc ribbon domain-containing protein [archaeon]
MKSSGKCPKCGSIELVPTPKLVTGGGLTGGEGLGASVDLFGNVSRQFEAIVCMQCGYTEMYLPKKFLTKKRL